MSNGMPLVHHARRLRANYEAGNPFSTLAGLKAHLSAMEARYIDPRTGPKVSQRLHVEIDLMADLIDAQH
jgi:hypothetical protein